MDIFTGNKKIDIVLYYTSINDDSFVIKVLEEEEALKMLANDKQKASVYSLKTIWRRPSWGSKQQILNQCFTYNRMTNQQEFNQLAFNDALLKNYLISWDAKDDKGNEIPISADAIDNLHETIADALITKFIKVTYVDPSEKSKN